MLARFLPFLLGLTCACTETKLATSTADDTSGVGTDGGLPDTLLADIQAIRDTPDTPPSDVSEQTDALEADSVDDASDSDGADSEGDVAEIPDEGVDEDLPVVGDADGGSDFDEGPDTTGPALGPPLGPRSCTVPVSVQVFGESPSSVSLAGEFNGWDSAATPLTSAGGDVWKVDLDTSSTPPGSYAYKFVFNGNDWRLDPVAPMRKIVDGVENSKLLVPDCKVPLLELETLENTAERLRVVVTVRDGASASGLTADSPAVLRGGQPLSAADWTWDAVSQRFVVDIPTPPLGKYGLVFEVRNAAGLAEPLYLPIWREEEAFTWQDATLYFVMTDRFLDGDAGNNGSDSCTSLPANWNGGDLAGLLTQIENGYFDSLGVRALWLTALVDNPAGCVTGSGDGRQYTSYHGYFPASQDNVEEHIGTLADIQAVSAAAHARGIRVLVDLVANHLHSSHPFVAEHQGDGWFNAEVTCQNGGFDSLPFTCWFEPYLPDLNYERDGPVEAMSEMALRWVRRADLDGFRVDAVKHMHPNFLRTLVHKLGERAETVPGARFYLVGETFTGEWGGGQGANETLIKKYVGPDLLDGQFDFPLFWPLLQAFGRHEKGLSALGDIVAAAQGYYGPDAVMSTFLGNHDVARFISHAAGHIGDLYGNGSKEQAWNNPPGLPTGTEAFDRLGLAFSFLFTAPGVPLVYYGDEIGLPGAGDPDNRRMMPWSGLSQPQLSLRETVGKLGVARRTLPALRRGDFTVLKAESDVLVYRRATSGQSVIVGLNRAGNTMSITVPATDGAYTEALTGGTGAATGGSFTFGLPARGARIWSH